MPAGGFSFMGKIGAEILPRAKGRVALESRRQRAAVPVRARPGSLLKAALVTFTM
jgi:hypothetical protein